MENNNLIHKESLLKAINNRIKRLESERLQVEAKIQALREVEIAIELDKW